ncbi:MAG: hypothetical protein QOJ73_4862 [Streptosporangiaceae bacterium]|jgi:hypothetical protein|nr:hypothetical protein [Streptosporangiaceae bacterium]
MSDYLGATEGELLSVSAGRRFLGYQNQQVPFPHRGPSLGTGSAGVASQAIKSQASYLGWLGAAATVEGVLAGSLLAAARGRRGNPH